ncbi:MAG TPA: peptidoglycan editing factor PgeF, partial [Steroidobacteraceae bacterium]
SLNLGAHVGDEPAAVSENRRRLRAGLRLPAEPLWLSQVHSTVVVAAEQLSANELAPQGDAALTRQPGHVLAVLVADCLPVLLARRDGTAVAVAHAGWRGLAAGVIEATIAALGCAGHELVAWLGPAIGPAHFEVGDEVRAAFCHHHAEAEQAFLANDRGRWQCDLHLLARQRLGALGVHSIHAEARCTYAQSDAFYSYRREGTTGRMAALIWLAGGP